MKIRTVLARFCRWMLFVCVFARVWAETKEQSLQKLLTTKYSADSKGPMQQQYFRKEPLNISAAVGSEITLQCEVENQAGSVQWTKDGFALGYNRTIPGFPRYTFYSDELRGIFNLNIRNVSLEDDSEFQCQVKPAITPIIHKPIRSAANLTVISPPLTIEIIGLENNSKLEIRENHFVKLQCQAKNAKPAARIVWYRGRTELKSDNQEDNVTESRTNVGKKFRLYDVTSEIHLQPSIDDDGVNYTCEAIHEALPSWKRLKATIQLSVLYPPGLPYIKGYSEGDILRHGQNVELSCQSRGGNPPAQLVWYKNGEQVKAIYRTIGRVSENVYSFTADMTDNKARFTCEASSVINRTRLTTEVNLTVYYPPAIVIINGSSEARVGDVIPLSCTTGVSNPPATIKWLIDGKQVENAASKIVASLENGWITYSNITVVVEPNKTSVVAICYGVNAHVNENKVATHTITVLYPPGKPEIRRKNDSAFVAAGSLQTLTCLSVGGNPLASLTWSRNDKELAADIKVMDNVVFAEIKILVNGSDNDAIYKCEAKNPAIDIPYFKTTKLPVYFSPMQAKISAKPEELRAGTIATLTCDVGASNPEPELSWWMDHFEVGDEIAKYCKSGLYGGKVCTTELVLNLTADMDGRRYTCQALNVPLDRSAHDTITLNVLYKPQIAELNETVFTEVEGKSLVIPLRVSAHPNKIKFTWSKDGVPLTQNYESTLNISRLHRSDSGLYSCEALNSLGSTRIEFRVSVLYAATIIHISDVILVAERETATLQCTVDGNPLTAEHVTWKRAGFPMEAKTNFSFENITSSLTVHNVTLDDMGFFYCVVDNSIGNESSEPAFLVVKHKPVIDLSGPLSKAAAHVGNTAKLICKATGAPKVNFSWSKRGMALPQNTTEKYIMLYKEWDVIHYMSTLLIHNVVPQDYEEYGCTARNSMGFSTHHVKLLVVSPPDPPYHLETVNATHDSITLLWKPGFDGGETAFYRIRCTVADVERPLYKFYDVGSATVFTVQKLRLGTCYLFNVMAQNKLGSSNYMRDELRSCSLSEGPPSLPSRGEVSNDNINKLPFAVGLIVAITLIFFKISIVIFCIIRRSKKKYKEAANQQVSKSENTDLYSSNNFNDQMHAESITSVSEKSENYDKGYNPLDEGRCSALNTYLIEEIDYPFQDTSAYEIEVKPDKYNSYRRTSTICRNGSLCQRIDPNLNVNGDPQFIAYPPPVQFAQCSLQYMSNQRGHIPRPPPDVTVQTAQNVPLSTFNYNVEHEGQLV